MVENGYKLQKDGDGTWSVIDAFKGNPITFEGKLQIALNEDEASGFSTVSTDRISNATPKTAADACLDP
ncbi:hypothetical protein [Brucella oryzae]|uniref:hypothetical protein n=1 Tax=Brucella oryzae TaxID=335286 RepID=UPI0035BBC376